MLRTPGGLRSTDHPLISHYELAMLDLDGVVYVGDDAVPRAGEAITRAVETGSQVAFVTNNASRPPAQVSEKLNGLGVPASPVDVVTSAQAAARVTRDRFGGGASVAVLGSRGVTDALTEYGLIAVAFDDDAVEQVDAVVSGYGPEVPWRVIMDAAVRIRNGVPWVACNTDYTIPIASGVGPGHGVLVDMLRRFTGVEPLVAGKPAPALLHETMDRMGTTSAVMVGDRLDTDIEGGRAVEVDTLLVLTGVSGLREVVDATPEQRPHYLGVDLNALHRAHREVHRSDDTWRCGRWTARISKQQLMCHASTGDPATGESAEDVEDWWRAAAAAAWDSADELGQGSGHWDIAQLQVPDQRPG